MTAVRKKTGAPPAARRAGRGFFSKDPARLAVALLGQRLVRTLPDGERLSGIIVETEAYLGVADRAAHSYGGRRTARVEPMYGPPGTAYVYFTYGMHHCFNVVCGREGEPVAVLIRGLEPERGIERMRTLRGRAGSVQDLCRGPGRLCRAMQIDKALDGIDLVRDARLFIEIVARRPMESRRLVNTPRIGVGYAGRWARRRLRWLVRGNPHVSVGR
jgi:DNA-3-methyladenine glycosylase